MKITIGTDCGNAPKKVFLKELTTAFMERNSAFLSNSVTDEITWNIIGDQIITGKEKLRSKLEDMKQNKVSALTIDKVLTHGKEGAVNGTMRMMSGAMRGFSDFYEFSGAKGAKVKSITSYAIKMNKKSKS